MTLVFFINSRCCSATDFGNNFCLLIGCRKGLTLKQEPARSRRAGSIFIVIVP
jgi:hypothetical protein